MLYPIIDIGSATIRMAIYDIEKNDLKLIHKRKYTVGLAAYVKNEIMTEEGIAKASEILLEFKDFLRAFNINTPVAFTTAALRNCLNSKDAVAQIRANTGIDLHVISGDQEAWYDFIAITHGLKYQEGFIMDIGGASTELIHFTHNEINEKISLPIGSLALHTKFIQGIFPTGEEIATMQGYLQQQFNKIKHFAGSHIPNICGIGGTFKGTSLLYNQVHQLPNTNSQIPVGELDNLIQHFLLQASPLQEEDVITLLTAVPDRLKTIFPGMIIAKEIANFLGAENITYRDAGMREGFIYAHLINK